MIHMIQELFGQTLRQAHLLNPTMDLSRVCCARAVVANIFVTCRRRCLTGPEDSETAKRSFIDGTSAKVDRVPSENSGNPSSRRGGLCISLRVKPARALMTMFSN